MSALEAGLFTCSLDAAMVGPAQPCILTSADITEGATIAPAQHGAYWFAFGFHRFSRQANTLNLFLRYQAQAERLYRRAVEEFERLKALRSELPNEPISPTEPQETESVTTPETNPSPLPQPAPGSPLPAVTPRPENDARPRSDSAGRMRREVVAAGPCGVVEVRGAPISSHFVTRFDIEPPNP